MESTRTLTDKIFLILKGLGMGAANKVPGVSGGEKGTGRDTKHYIANTLPWFQFVHGHLPNYPVDILKANLELIKIQLHI